MNVQCSGCSRSFAKETRALKMSVVAVHCKLTMPIERIIKADPLTREVSEELKIDHSIVIQHLRQTGKLKKFDKWVPHELTTNQKTIIILKYCLLFYTTKQAISQSECDMR